MDARFDESVTGFIPDEIVLFGDIPANQVFNGERKKGFVFCFFVFCFAIGIEPASFCPAMDILHGIRKSEGRSSEVAIAIAACARGKNTLACSEAGANVFALLKSICVASLQSLNDDGGNVKLTAYRQKIQAKARAANFNGIAQKIDN